MEIKKGNNKNRSIFCEEYVVLPVANSIYLWTGEIAQKRGKHSFIESGRTLVEEEVANRDADFSNAERKGWDIVSENTKEEKIPDETWQSGKMLLSDCKEYLLSKLS